MKRTKHIQNLFGRSINSIRHSDQAITGAIGSQQLGYRSGICPSIPTYPFAHPKSVSRQSWLRDFEPVSHQIKESEKSATRIFVERVSVAGVPEAFGQNSKLHEKFIFRVALVLAALAIAFNMYTVLIKFTQDTRVFDDLDVVNEQPPFPNLTICGPEVIRTSVVAKFIDDHIDQINKVKDFQTVDMGQLIREVKALISFNLRPKPMSKLGRAIIKALSSVQFGQAAGSGIDLRTLYPTCSDMFSKCSFQGKEFDCCDLAVLMLFDERLCYHFGLSLLQQKTPSDHDHLTSPPRLSQFNDNLHIDQNGLVIDVHIDWTDVLFWDDLAINGFNVFIGPLPSPWYDPIAIPADMDASVLLAPPQQLRELSDCRSRDSLPQFRFARYYDPYGVGCIGEHIADSLEANYGCYLPGLNFDVENGTGLCTLEQGIGLSYVFNGEAFKDNSRGIGASDGRIKNSEMVIRDIGHAAFGQCLPFCDRYLYDVISVSYGSMIAKDLSNWSSDHRKNQSWSHVKVFFPSATYRRHFEKAVNPGYMAACEIGGIMGVYAGFSMLTLVQITVYSTLICIKCKKHQ